MPKKDGPIPRQKRPKRKITFLAGNPSEASRLSYRLIGAGVAVDRIPQPGGDTVIHAVGDAEKHADKDLPKQMAKGLKSVKVEADEVADKSDDYPLSRDFFAAVAANLLAGDIQARVVANAEVTSVEVKLIDGSRVLWSNALWTKEGDRRWGYALIPLGGQMTGGVLDHPWDDPVEDVARMIAMFDYPAPAEFPREHPGVSNHDPEVGPG